jgi:pyrroloquinoline quinone biosynthesis protein D
VSPASPVDTARVPRIAPKARLQWDEVRERHVLLYPEGLVTLNDTGVAILTLCDGERTLADVVTTLEERYRTAGLAGDVATFLDGLAAKGLVIYQLLRR